MSFHDSMYDDGFCSEEDYLDHLYDVADKEWSRMEQYAEEDDEYEYCEEEVCYDDYLDEEPEIPDEYMQELAQSYDLYEKWLERYSDNSIFAMQEKYDEYNAWSAAKETENIQFELYYQSIDVPFERDELVINWIYWKRNKMACIWHSKIYYGENYSIYFKYLLWRKRNILECLLMGELQNCSKYKNEEDELSYAVRKWTCWCNMKKKVRDFILSISKDELNKYRRTMSQKYGAAEGCEKYIYLMFNIRKNRYSFTDEEFAYALRTYYDDKEKALRTMAQVLIVREYNNDVHEIYNIVKRSTPQAVRNNR